MTKDKRFNVIELFVLKLKGYRMFHVGKQVKLLPRFRKFLAFGILLLSMSADFIISGEQIISLFPHEIAQYIVSFLCYDLQTFDCLRKTSKYWKEICDSEKISLRVLENLREQNYKLPQGYNEKELDLYKKKLCVTLPKHRNFLELFRHNPYDCHRSMEMEERIKIPSSMRSMRSMCYCYLKQMNIKENFKISIQEDFNQGQITIAIKDPSENKEKKYLFCYALNSIKTLFTEVDKFESVFVWLPISHWQGSTFKKYVDLLHAYIIIITIDKSKTEEKKAEIIKKVVNLINFNGESILHGLCKNYGSWESSDRKKLIEHFIKHGANINQSDYAKKIHLYGYTPFEYACKVGGREIIKFLLQHGAKTNLNHECGKKLLERARANRLPDAPGFLDLVEKSCDPVLLKKFDKTQKNSKKLKRNRNSSNQLKINQKNSGETISKVTDQNNNDINNIEGVRTRMVVHEYGTWVMGVLAIIYHFLLKQ